MRAERDGFGDVRIDDLRGARGTKTCAEATSPIDDPSGAMGIRLLVQSCGEPVARVFVEAKTPTLLLPVHAGLAEVQVGAERHLVDRASWVLIPAGRRATVRAKSPVTQTMMLSVTPLLRAAVVQMYGCEIRMTRFERYVTDVQFMVRTTWVNELIKPRVDVSSSRIDRPLVKRFGYRKKGWSNASHGR